MKPKRQQQDRTFVRKKKKREEKAATESIAHEMTGKNTQLKTMGL